MKVSLSRPQSKKIKSTLQSKKNSHTNSLIYKQINSQMQQLFSKSKYLNYQLLNPTPTTKQKQEKVSKKNSYINMKKKSETITNSKQLKEKEKISLSTSQDASKLILNKMKDNFMAGMNSPVSNASSQSENEEEYGMQIYELKKNLDLKTIQPSMTTKSSTQPRPRSQKLTQNPSPLISSSTTTPTATLSKKSYTKTKIKLQTKIFPSSFKLQRKLFCYDYIIGKGGFGKVWKVEHIKTRNQYAMKEMLKSIVITKKSVQSVMNERVLLSQLNSPFLVNMHYAFQDRDTLYLVLDLMQGGDLRYHIGNKIFSEIQAKFFVACIILGLEHMHKCNIIHRDIKPENLVLDSRGYIRITDLGIARTFRLNNSSDTSGTPGYMSPEVICRQNHSFVSDFFALGVIAYELMTGKRPYNGRTRNQIRENMLAKQAAIKPSQMPEGWSYEAGDFINRLIQRKPQNRLGFNGIEEIKAHPWVRTINWDRLYSKEIQSPFIPLMKKKNFDQDEQITIEDEQEAAMIEKNSLLLRKPEFQQLFKDYYYDENENLQTAKEPPRKPSITGSMTNTPTAIQAQLQKQKQSKKKLTASSKQKQKQSISQKIAQKKYSEQLYLKRPTHATIADSQHDMTMKQKKKNSINESGALNVGKLCDNVGSFMVKDCQIIQSLNNSDIIEPQPVVNKDKRKNSQPAISQPKTFFKDFKY